MKKSNAMISSIMMFIVLSNGYVATINAQQPKSRTQQNNPKKKKYNAKSQAEDDERYSVRALVNRETAQINGVLNQCEQATLRTPSLFYTQKHGLKQAWFTDLIAKMGASVYHSWNADSLTKHVIKLANSLLDTLSHKMPEIKRDRQKLNTTVTRMAKRAEDIYDEDM